MIKIYFILLIKTRYESEIVTEKLENNWRFSYFAHNDEFKTN